MILTQWLDSYLNGTFCSKERVPVHVTQIALRRAMFNPFVDDCWKLVVSQNCQDLPEPPSPAAASAHVSDRESPIPGKSTGEPWS